MVRCCAQGTRVHVLLNLFLAHPHPGPVFAQSFSSPASWWVVAVIIEGCQGDATE